VNFKKILLVSIIVIFVCSGLKLGFAQQDGDDIKIGKLRVIHSDVFDADRNICIYRPDDYSNSQESYPVLYFLYGGPTDFHFNTGVIGRLSSIRMIPKMMAVAVAVGDGQRDLTPTKSPDYGPTSGGAADFLKYINEEVIPFVDQNYRTTPQRLFWSHSIGGLFGIYALLEEPEVFQSVLVSSPWMTYDRDQKYILMNTGAFLEKRNKQSNFLYICVGNEPNLMPQIEEFLQILEKNKPEGLLWKYVKMPEENHTSIIARSLIAGLKAFGSK